MDNEQNSDSLSLAERFKEEMREYLFISLYLWVCFTVIFLYQAAVSDNSGQHVLVLGTAVVKALIIGKFILIGKALKPGSHGNASTLVRRILMKSISMLAILLVFTLLEELIVGSIHGQAVTASFTEFVARPALQLIAPALMMLLVLIPMIAFEEVDRELGKGMLRHLLFGKN